MISLHRVAPVVLTGLALHLPAHAQDPTPPADVEVRDAGAVRDIEAATAELRRAQAEVRRAQAELRREREQLARERAAWTSPSRAIEAERVAVGSESRVEEDQVVDEVAAFGSDVHVFGEVLGNATSFGGSVFVHDGGRVRGDAAAFGGTVQVDEGGRVDGGRVSFGVPGVPNQERQASALGSVGEFADGASDLLNTLYRRLVLLLSFAGAGVLVVGLFPSRVGRIASTLEERPFRSAFVGTMATGFLGLFSVLFALITLGLGFPVSLVVWAVLGLAWLMGFVGLCQAVGDRLPFEQKPHGRWLAFLVGTILITCAGSLPLVGWLVLIAASAVGIGASLSSRFGAR